MRTRKACLSVVVLVILVCSVATAEASSTGIINGTLSVVGSASLASIAVAEANQFPTYWNSLVAANPNGGSYPVVSVDISAQGSGTAISGLIAGADVGQMSRCPQTASEWGSPAMANMQLWAVGIESIAVVVSPDMTWFPTDLTTMQVAKLFARSSPGGSPYYSTYGDFLADYYGGAQNIPSSIPTAVLTATINRAVRDSSSGVADCFNVFFGVPNGFNLKNPDVLAPYTYGLDVYTAVHTGNLASNTEYIGYLPLSQLQTDGGVIGLNIAFNMHNPPVSTVTNDPAKTWGPYVEPTLANVQFACSGVQGGAATGQYMAWRWLWGVTSSAIPNSGADLEKGVWIAYMKAQNTTQGGVGNFIFDSNVCVEMLRADMAGGQVVDANLAAYTPLPSQTQTVPDGKVDSADFFYFVDAYVHYYNANLYNPYADFDANGKIDASDFFSFVDAYIYGVTVTR